MAQLASVLAWGARGRKFESSHPDYLKTQKQPFTHTKPAKPKFGGFFVSP